MFRLTDLPILSFSPNLRRVVGNPFPPFDNENLDSWGVQNLLHPSIPYSRDTQPSSSASTSSNPFLTFYSSSPLLEVSCHLLSVNSISSMQLELFNLLIEPSQHAFALAWHRDDIKPNVDQEEESKRLKAPDNGVQWNVALEDDDCLFVIPGTHQRLRSQEEIKANQMKTPEAVLIKNGEEIGFDGSWEEDPKTTLKVRLKGEIYYPFLPWNHFLAFENSLNDVWQKPLLSCAVLVSNISWSSSLLFPKDPSSSFLSSKSKESNSSWLFRSCRSNEQSRSRRSERRTKRRIRDRR